MLCLLWRQFPLEWEGYLSQVGDHAGGVTVYPMDDDWTDHVNVCRGAPNVLRIRVGLSSALEWYRFWL
eukprot:609377-Amphidinium_carterae.1